MASEVSNYKCPACTGPLRFDAASGKLVCDYCDSVYELSYIEGLVRKSDGEKAAGRGSPLPGDAEDDWEQSELIPEWGEDAENLTAFSCPSCGAEIICEKTTAATSCPYCNNNTIIQERLAGTWRPDYIIPFKVSRKDAEAALKTYYDRSGFLPKKFKTGSRVREINGLYVPFWFFDAEASARITMEGRNTRVYREGDNEITATDHYKVYREGDISFDKIPVDASSKMPDDYMDSLEPYNYSELTKFSTAYLPGFMADKYDEGADICFKRAEKRCRNSIIQEIEDTVQGYTEKISISRDVEISRGKAKYGLLPVWMLSTRWKDKNYMFALNGQTGKMVGNLPLDILKVIITFLAIMIAGGLLVWAIMLSMISNEYNEMLAVCLIGGAIVSGIITYGLVATRHNVMSATNAAGYTVQGSFDITKSYDHFTHTTRTVRKLQKKNKH